MCIWSFLSFLLNIFVLAALLLIIGDYIVGKVCTQETNMTSNTVEENMSSEENNIPEIYVDEHILRPIVLDCEPAVCEKPLIFDKIYEINGEIFRENVWKDSGTLSKFEIQTRNDGNGEREVTIHEAADIYLPVSIQETPYGLLINSNILLTVGQWNTIVEQEDGHKCIVCDANIGGTIEHIDSDIHLRNLEKYQPLKKFDLCITRLINNIYHCGVCNECFDRNAENQHFDSKNHEEKMLFATNRASDVMFDFDLHDEYRNSDHGKTDNVNKNNDCYHFNRNRILSLSDTSGFDSAEGFYDYDYDDNVPYVSDNDNESNDNGNRCHDNEYSSNDNKFGVVENNEYNEPNYVSYASIAKKVEATPDYLYVTIFNKRMKMKFDHWHMINTFKSYKTNQLYCMVCKQYYQITLKAEHCAEKTHLDKLQRYKFVEKYKNCFIRKIDDKYYHCGICNNIQLAAEIDKHIQAKHKEKVKPALLSEDVPKKIKNNDNSTKNTRTGNDKNVTLPMFKEPKNNRNTDKMPHVMEANLNNIGQYVMNSRNENKEYLTTRNAVHENQVVIATATNNNNDVIKARNENNDKNATKITNNGNGNEINNESPNIHNDIILNQNGFRIRVSFMSYNFICKRQNYFYCHICNVTASEMDMTCHINEQGHLCVLRNISFQDKYGIHLIRMIGFQDHCTICNILFSMEDTKAHILDNNHIQMLTKALATDNYQNHTYSPMQQLRNDANQQAMNHPTMGMNQPSTFMNQHIMQNPTMGINQPSIFMNQPAMPPPLMGIHPPLLGMQPISMNQISPPTLVTPRWPITPPSMHASGLDLNQRAINQLNIHTHQIKTNMNEHVKSQPKVEMNRHAMNQTTTHKKHSIPNFVTNQSEMNMNQDAIVPSKIDKNQEIKTELLDMNQAKKDMNQRATNQAKYEDNSKKIDSTIESIQDMFDLNESIDDVDDDFECLNERFVYLKFKNTYVQVGLAAYNSLFNIGDGTTYCFVCSLRVYGSMKKHVESKNHSKCMDECKFVGKYDRHLLRQMFLNYHCSICNIIFTRKDINKHITWPLHLQDTKTEKKARKRDLKSGKKLLKIEFQNEAIYLNEKEPEVKILVKIEIRANCQNVETLQKKNKIIIFGGKVLRISWDAYHGFCKNKSGQRCVLCQRDVRSYEMSAHVAGDYHKRFLDAFETPYLPHLIRKISETTLNCVLCNVEVPNKEHIIKDHVCAKKHKRNYDAILQDSRTVASYADCNEDVLNLCSS